MIHSKQAQAKKRERLVGVRRVLQQASLTFFCLLWWRLESKRRDQSCQLVGSISIAPHPSFTAELNDTYPKPGGGGGKGMPGGIPGGRKPGGGIPGTPGGPYGMGRPARAER